METNRIVWLCWYHISEEDDTHVQHNDGLFDVPYLNHRSLIYDRGTSMYGKANECERI